MSHHQTAGEKHSIKTANKFFENVVELRSNADKSNLHARRYEEHRTWGNACVFFCRLNKIHKNLMSSLICIGMKLGLSFFFIFKKTLKTCYVRILHYQLTGV